MKIVQNNFKSKNSLPKSKPKLIYPRKITCEYCNSELEYDKEDIIIGEFGVGFIKCPCCGEENMLEDEEGITLTVNNVEFPNHFHHTSLATGAKDISAEEIKNYIKEAITYFKNHKEDSSYNIECGTVCVTVFRCDGDQTYHVIVTKDFYETELEFETEDYV